MNSLELLKKYRDYFDLKPLEQENDVELSIGTAIHGDEPSACFSITNFRTGQIKVTRSLTQALRLFSNFIQENKR